MGASLELKSQRRGQRMKRRYSVWRLRLGGYRSEAMRRLGKTPDEGKLQLGDIVICCSLLGLLNIDILPESVP